MLLLDAPLWFGLRGFKRIFKHITFPRFHFDSSNAFDLIPHSSVFVSLLGSGFVVAMQIVFSVTYATENLRSVFLILFPHHLNFSSVFLRDLF
jgi:hypothetical protein